jgi:hypothetical protein
MRQALECEPLAPSRLTQDTPDSETICLKCPEERPEQRYHSARNWAEELGRFLRSEPVLAKPSSVWRKAWSWSLRNPWAFIIGMAAAMGLALPGVGHGLWERVQCLEWRGVHIGPDRANGRYYVNYRDPVFVLITGSDPGDTDAI